MEKVLVDRDSLTAIHLNWKEDRGKTYYVDFEIYDISWCGLNGKTGERNYPIYINIEDYNIKSDHKPSEETKPKIRGHIKWDGCCNYEYNEEPMFHMCGLGGFYDEYMQIKKAYELAAEIMGDVADLDMMGLLDEKDNN